MKTLKEVLENYDKYRTFLQDRLGARLCDFLTEEQANLIGFQKAEDKEWPTPKEWTRENILKQLEADIDFGFEKAINQRGISSSLMFSVVQAWNFILEEGLEDWPDEEYAQYGLPLFIATAKKYNFSIPSEITSGDTGKEFKYGIDEYWIDPYCLPVLYYINDTLGFTTIASREGLYKGKDIDDWNRSVLEPNAYIAFQLSEENIVLPFLEHLHTEIPEMFIAKDGKGAMWGKLRAVFPVPKDAQEKDIKELWDKILKLCESWKRIKS